MTWRGWACFVVATGGFSAVACQSSPTASDLIESWKQNVADLQGSVSSYTLVGTYVSTGSASFGAGNWRIVRAQEKFRWEVGDAGGVRRTATYDGERWWSLFETPDPASNGSYVRQGSILFDPLQVNQADPRDEILETFKVYPFTLEQVVGYPVRTRRGVMLPDSYHAILPDLRVVPGEAVKTQPTYRLEVRRRTEDTLPEVVVFRQESGRYVPILLELHGLYGKPWEVVQTVELGSYVPVGKALAATTVVTRSTMRQTGKPTELQSTRATLRYEQIGELLDQKQFQIDFPAGTEVYDHEKGVTRTIGSAPPNPLIRYLPFLVLAALLIGAGLLSILRKRNVGSK